MTSLSRHAMARQFAPSRSLSSTPPPANSNRPTSSNLRPTPPPSNHHHHHRIAKAQDKIASICHIIYLHLPPPSATIHSIIHYDKYCHFHSPCHIASIIIIIIINHQAS
jgi:hypothetical protein